ncbi:MAG: class B sortase [Ruminococcus flavefaciens]|nr:class B sortase [Ruminococcus flavefaciens]MCM1229060.1 class B sortase [Ruminococcus flavefaciens]
MSENNNGFNSDIDEEAMARAEKIKAIRKAVDSGRRPEDAEIPESLRRREQLPPIHRVRKENVSQDSAVRTAKKKTVPKKKKKKTFLQKIRGLFPERGDSVLESIRKVVFLASIVAIVVCGYMVGDYYLDLWRNGMRNDQFSAIHGTYSKGNYIPSTADEPEENVEEKYYEKLVSAQKLLDMNPEYIGFITLPTKDGDPVFELPIVKTTDNDKYLNMDFLGGESRAGTLFMDWRNNFDEVGADHHLAVKNSDNLVVYGHNMADESMFGALKYYYRNNDYYDNHPIIYLESRYETYAYKIFSCFILDAFDKTETAYDCWNKLDFDSEEDFYDFVNEAKRRTLRTNNIDVKYGDQLLTLSTCNTLLGDNGRLIIMARQVRPGEDLYEGTESEANPNIKFPSLYYQTRTNERYDPDAPFVPYGPAKKSSKTEE